VADEYRVKVKWDGGPFKIDETTESVIRKSDLPGQTALLDRLKGVFAGN
jgi:hypothetical protein